MVPPRAVQSAPRSAAEDCQAVSLDGVHRKSLVRVVSIAGGRGAIGALAQLGIRPDETLSVRRSAPLGGPVLVEGSGGTVAIGRGLARKVKVRVLS